MNRRSFVRSVGAGAAALAAGCGVGGAQGAGNVLEGVEQVGFGKTACLCYVGSLGAVMRYLGEAVTTDHLMGVSGGAFVILWGMPWCNANCDILFMGDAPLQPTFAALGYDYTSIHDCDHRKQGEAERVFRHQIVASIDRGCPVIAKGLVGPPECSVVFGYERGGEVLLGWSYFQEDGSRPFRVENWYDQCHGLLLVGGKKAEPSQREVLQGTLKWAIDLARTPDRGSYTEEDGTPNHLLVSGLAAYDAFAEGLEREADFPADNLEVLTSRLCPIANDGIYLMGCKRNAAARFLTAAADWGLPGTIELMQAADAYKLEASVWEAAGAGLPWTGAPEAERRKIADPTYRRKLAALVRQAKGHEEEAVELLEAAQQALAG